MSRFIQIFLDDIYDYTPNILIRLCHRDLKDHDNVLEMIDNLSIIYTVHSNVHQINCCLDKPQVNDPLGIFAMNENKFLYGIFVFENIFRTSK